MKNKGKERQFCKYYTFQKLIIISIATEIMTALTNFISNSPKTFEKLVTKKKIKKMKQSLKKSMQNNYRNKFCLSLSQRNRLDFRFQNLPKKHLIISVVTKLAAFTNFEIG